MKILFFAQLRDVVGCPRLEWRDAPVMSGDAVWARLIGEFPELAGHRHSTRLARNGAYATAAEQFQPGDEVALIPPVSGG